MALEVAVSADSPRKRPTQTALIDPLSDCSTLEPSTGKANSRSVRGIGPLVRSPVRRRAGIFSSMAGSSADGDLDPVHDDIAGGTEMHPCERAAQLKAAAPFMPSRCPQRTRQARPSVQWSLLLGQTRQRDLIDQEHGVDIGAVFRLVGRANLETVLGKEVVVVGDEQEVVVGQLRIEHADH